MVLIGNTVYLHFEDLAECGIKTDTAKKGATKGRSIWQSIKDPADQRRLLIKYETMSQRYKEMVRKQFGDPRLYLMGKQHEQEEEKTSSKVQELIDMMGYCHHGFFVRQMTPEKAREHARAAAWMEFLIDVRLKVDAQALGYESKAELWGIVVECLEKENLSCLRARHIRSLRMKVRQYKKDGPGSLIHGHRGNQNATKIETEKQKEFLMALMADPHKIPVVMITRMYNREAPKKGWEQITANTARNFLNRPENKIVWTMGRHGKDVWKNKYEPTIRRKRPSAPDAMWIFDGSPLDLYYRKTVKKWNEKKGEWQYKETYYNRMDMMLVIDGHSWRIVGAALSPTETATAVRAAIKRAVQERMVVPVQLQYDQGSGIKAQKWMLKNMGVVNTPTRPYSGKSKVIEPVIGHIQNMILRYFDNWAGMNVRAKRDDSQFNPDFLKENRDKLPDYKELVRQFEDAINVWNNLATKDRESPNVMYAKESVGKPVDAFDFVTMFWEKRNTTYRYRTDGIQLEINGEKHLFNVTDPDMYRLLVEDDFEVAFDPDCLDFVYLYQDNEPVRDENGEPVMAVATELLPMAVYDHEEGDRTKVNELLKVRDDLVDDIEEVTGDLKRVTENNLKLGVRSVFKEELNTAETEFKRFRLDIDEDDVDWGKILENEYVSK